MSQPDNSDALNVRQLEDAADRLRNDIAMMEETVTESKRHLANLEKAIGILRAKIVRIGKLNLYVPGGEPP